METNNETFVPFETATPAEIIEDEMLFRGMSKDEFAERMSMSVSDANHLLKGQNITQDIANRLEKTFGIPADVWVEMQRVYEANVINITARDVRENEARTEEAYLSEYIDCQKLFKRLGLTEGFEQDKLAKAAELVGAPLKDFLSRMASGVCIKKGCRSSIDMRNLNTWLVLAHVNARRAQVVGYKEGSAREAADEIALLTNSDSLTEDGICSILKSCGIAYAFEPQLSGTPIDAVAMMVDGVPSVVTTHRRNDLTRLVFDVLKALAHIELHVSEGNEVFFVSDVELYDYKLEREANKFAEDVLIPPTTWRDIMSKSSQLAMKSVVETLTDFANFYKLNVGVVLWRYRYESERFVSKGLKAQPIV